MGEFVGYARTSTLEQQAGFEAQLRQLQELGCKKVFQEQVSATGERENLERTLEYIREDDTLVVTKLDRLARSVRHLGEIVETLEKKGAMLKILNLNLDTGSPTGKLMLNMLGAVAQFEREMMLERQREGIAKAKSEGKYKGRPKSYSADQVKELRLAGVSVKEITQKLGMSRASVYRLLEE